MSNFKTKLVNLGEKTEKVITIETKLREIGWDWWIDRDISELNFPISKNSGSDPEPMLMSFDSDISSEKVIEYIARENFKPGSIWDLLDFLTRNSKETETSGNIIALGSVVTVGFFLTSKVPCFTVDYDEDKISKYLKLVRLSSEWPAGRRFLVVHV